LLGLGLANLCLCDHVVGTISIKNAKLATCINEMFLWHGTKQATSQCISEEGFDERVGSLGGLFGAGIYFGMLRKARLPHI